MLVDSSAWIEFVRDTGSPQCLAVERAVRDGQVHVTDPVRLEVLAGAGRGVPVEDLVRMLDSGIQVPQVPREDVEFGASIFRECRTHGETVRALNDCLIAAIAIRAGVPVLHRDRDYDVIARHTELQVATS